MSTEEELRGEALDERARELDIQGRSEMTADEKRDAIAQAEGAGGQTLRVERLGTARAQSIPGPKGAEDVEEFSVVVVDNAHAVLTINGKAYRLGQSDVSDARKVLDSAFINLH